MSRIKLYARLAGVAIRHPVKTVQQLKPQNISKLRRAMARRSEDYVYELVHSNLPITGKALSKQARLMERSYPGITEPMGISRAFALEQRLRPPLYEVRETAPRMVNVLLPHLDPNIIFGGYIACLEFLRKLVERGHHVRILLCEVNDFDRGKILERFASNPPLRDALASCAIENLSYSQHRVVISPKDAFISYSAWTSLLAHELAKAASTKFIYFLQEHESIFHCNESERAIIDSVYDLPHFALFNTDILRDYFRQNRLGVYAPHQADAPESVSVAFQHALTPTSPPTLKEMQARKVKRLLFYGRPEAHARRNLFEIAYLGLRKAVAQGVFDDDWEFIGVGTLGQEYTLPLGDEKVLKLTSKLPLGDYAAALKTFDLGISMMYAPHPSILPFEMASSGIVSVTNVFGQRDASVLTGISGNILPCAATVDSVAATLKEAVLNHVENHEARITNARLDWVMDWDSAFNEAVMAKVEQYIGV